MKFVVDENVSRLVIDSLVDAGHDVVSVHDISLTGAPDDAIEEKQIRGRVVVIEDARIRVSAEAQ